MKYRGDFVTNSSSSSFIVCFKNKEEYNKRMDVILRHASSQYTGTIYSDIELGIVSKQKVLKEIKEDIESCVNFKFFYGGRKNYSFEEMRRLENDPKVKKMLKEEVDKKFEEVRKSLPLRGVYSLVTYGDDDGDYFGALEHDIMPYMPFVYYVINNH